MVTLHTNYVPMCRAPHFVDEERALRSDMERTYGTERSYRLARVAFAASAVPTEYMDTLRDWVTL